MPFVPGCVPCHLQLHPCEYHWDGTESLNPDDYEPSWDALQQELATPTEDNWQALKHALRLKQMRARITGEPQITAIQGMK